MLYKVNVANEVMTLKKKKNKRKQFNFNFG